MTPRLLLSCLLAVAGGYAQSVGVFEAHGDVGVNPKSGSAEFSGGEYRISGGGANMWAKSDAFHFAWRRVSGDFVLTADVRFIGQGVHLHRKAVLMARSELTADSVYADVALHGDGLTSLQYRPAAGADTLEVRADAKMPVRLRLERRGNVFTMSVANPGEELKASPPVTVAVAPNAYVGLGVCSHDVQTLETAVFTNVRLEQRPRYRSRIRIYDLKSRQSREVYQMDGIAEAPNWTRDGKHLLINTGGRLYLLPAEGEAKLQPLGLDEKYRANNDHDLTRDGRWLAFSASSPESRQSQVYVAKADGSDVRLLTPKSPSYFHGWSPDGKWLAFVGQRDGKYELFRVAFDGGEEQRLTSAGAYDDGPEYTPDGKWIYFNSNRSGAWDIWRMPAAGAGEKDAKAERVTSDDGEDWFPHFSPNGKQVVFLSFPKGTTGHNDRMPGVVLRRMDAPGKRLKTPRIETLVTFFGGQGSINVNSWAPDSRRFAYVEYEPLP